MEIPLNESHKLALEISSCSQVCIAAKDDSHPCHKVVSWQAKQWEPEVTDVFDSVMHRPEAWTGDLLNAPIMFLSSNPSLDKMENFPSWNFDSWNGEEIARFGAERFTTSKTRGFGATESLIESEKDRTIGLSGDVSKQVNHWKWVRQVAAMVYGKSISETSAISDYVMTELVHCKSPHEEGVVEALSKCTQEWFGQIMSYSPAKLIFVAGVKSGKDFASQFSSQIPPTWGSWASNNQESGQGNWPKTKSQLDELVSSGKWDLNHQMLNSADVEIGGVTRTAIYIARPGGGGLCAPWEHEQLIHPELIKYWRSKI